MASSSGGFRNVFGEDRITPPLFDDTVGNEVSKVMKRWFFGGTIIELAGEAAFAGGLSGRVKPNRRVDGNFRAASAGDAEVKALRGIDGIVDPAPSRVIAVLGIEGQVQLVELVGTIDEAGRVWLRGDNPNYPFRRIVKFVPISPRLEHLVTGG